MNDGRIVSRVRWTAAVSQLAQLFALAGGLLLCGLAALVVASILGRIFLARPVPGDFELVALGTAISIFLCLPYCQLQRGNVTVDLFLSGASSGLRQILDGIAALLFAVLAILFAWRMGLGLVDAVRYQDVSVILGVPLWWAYPPAVMSFALLAVCCLITASDDLGT